MALPCFLWGSGSRTSGGVCVRAVCSGLGLRSCSATPPPPLADSVSAVSAGEGPRRPAPRVPGDTRRAAQDQPSEEKQRHSDTAAAGVTGRCRLRGGAGGGDPTPSGGRRTAEASGEGGQRRPPAGRQPALGMAAGTGKMPGSAWNGFAACHLRRGACQRGRHWQEHRHCQMTVEALPACGKEGQGEGGGMALGGGGGLTAARWPLPGRLRPGERKAGARSRTLVSRGRRGGGAGCRARPPPGRLHQGGPGRARLAHAGSGSGELHLPEPRPMPAAWRTQRRLQLGAASQPSSRCGPRPGTSARCGRLQGIKGDGPRPPATTGLGNSLALQPRMLRAIPWGSGGCGHVAALSQGSSPSCAAEVFGCPRRL